MRDGKADRLAQAHYTAAAARRHVEGLLFMRAPGLSFDSVYAERSDIESVAGRLRLHVRPRPHSTGAGRTCEVVEPPSMPPLIFTYDRLTLSNACG